MKRPRELPDDPGLERATRVRPDGTPYVGVTGTRPPRRFAHDRPLDRLVLELSDAFGPQHWWPAATPFEVLVGAVLTQNTAWSNVERALAGLRAARALTPARILRLERGALEAAIRPSGYFRSKAEKLVCVSAWYLDAGGLRALRSRALGPLRDELLGVHGVGPETADSILCYAAGRRTAVVDAYTRRLVGRHGLYDDGAPYEELRTWLQERLVRSQPVYEEFHALCVRVGYHHCKPRPRCAACPATTPAAVEV